MGAPPAAQPRRPRVPLYFDQLIEAYRRGATERSVHLGFWRDGHDDGDFAAAQVRLDRWLIELAGITSRQSVLDVGCGFGGTLARVNESHDGMRLAGINIDERQIDICRRITGRPGNSVTWHLADAGQLPFGDDRFDRVLCLEAMFHFASRRQFFAEAARVLKPGGVLAGTDILIAPAARSVDVPVDAILQAGFGPWPDVWGEDAGHEELAAAAGLSGAVRDITIEVSPSYRYTAPPGAEPTDANLPAPLRASAALRWLHRRGWLKYVGFRFERPHAAGAAS